ncbi:uncharacterized protein [Diadema setosum]|uniref:uncharacterized protein n=1 Tax=Diadema setosum TaxID=31175 RepID=UPI003B3A499C
MEQGQLADTTPSMVHGAMNSSVIPMVIATKAVAKYLEKTKDLASRKIRVNAVSPSAGVLADVMGIPPLKEPRSPILPHQVPKLDDVTQAVAFLASDESLFITGENICVDGGYHASGIAF